MSYSSKEEPKSPPYPQNASVEMNTPKYPTTTVTTATKITREKIGESSVQIVSPSSPSFNDEFITSSRSHHRRDSSLNIDADNNRTMKQRFIEGVDLNQEKTGNNDKSFKKNILSSQVLILFLMVASIGLFILCLISFCIITLMHAIYLSGNACGNFEYIPFFASFIVTLMSFTRFSAFFYAQCWSNITARRLKSLNANYSQDNEEDDVLLMKEANPAINNRSLNEFQNNSNKSNEAEEYKEFFTPSPAIASSSTPQSNHQSDKVILADSTNEGSHDKTISSAAQKSLSTNITSASNNDSSLFYDRIMKLLVYGSNILLLLSGIFCGIFLISSAIAIVTLHEKIIPKYPNRLYSIQGLKEPVDIFIDYDGVFHIKAKNDLDMYFAQGYVTARERLWNLEFYKRVGHGTLSEILGEKALDVDVFSRTISWKEIAQKTYESLPEETKSILESYVRGVNTFISHHSAIPPEFYIFSAPIQTFTTVDVLLIFKLFQWQLTQNHDIELYRFLLLCKGLTREQVLELIPVDPLSNVTNPVDSNQSQSVFDLQPLLRDDNIFIPRLNTSPGMLNSNSLFDAIINPSYYWHANTWVISGKHTQNNSPILANDIHGPLHAPTPWILMHIESPSCNSIGNAFAGIPGIFAGKNKEISWGTSPSLADVADYYVLEEDGDTNTYIHNGTRLKYDIRTEVIKVARSNDITITVKQSIYGPVMNKAWKLDSSVEPLAFHWTGLLNANSDTSITAYLSLSHCKNLSEFQSNVAKFHSPALIFTFADREDNIAFFTAGSVPQRQDGIHSGLFPVAGNGNLDWKGYIPFNQMPSMINPSAGFIVSANQRIPTLDYPYVFHLDVAMSFRSKRIIQLLGDKIESQQKLTKEMIARIQNDETSELFLTLKPLLKLMKPYIQSDSVKAKIEDLEKWDGQEEGGILPAYFESWLSEMVQVVTEKEFISYLPKAPPNILRFLINILKQTMNNQENRESSTKTCFQYYENIESCVAFAAAAFENSVEELNGNERMDSMVPLWKDEGHHARFTNLALKDVSFYSCSSGRSVGIGGGTETISPGFISVAKKEDNLSATLAATYRQVIDMSQGEDDQNLFISALGQSGNWLLQSYGMYAQRWADGGYVKMKQTTYDVRFQMTLSNEPE